MKELLDLTIAIPVKNEQVNLGKCLQAIGNDFAKKVVVIDSGSTDATKEIAKQYNASVIDFDWNGKFPKKRNWFLRNHKPETSWIFFLDADEYITRDFKNEVRKALSQNDKDGYWLNYSIYFLGKQLRGGYPLRKLALFRVGAGEYEKIEEEQWSKLDMEVHEHPQLKGETGVIRSKIDHQDLRDVSHYLMKHNEYACWEASRFLKTRAQIQTAEKWTWKQRLKYRLMHSVLLGPVYFCGSFILMGGFKDGVRGLAFAIFKMAYFNQVYCKIQEYKNVSAPPSPLLKRNT